MQIFCVFEKSYAKKRKKILYLCIQDYVMHTKNVLENGFFQYIIRCAVEKDLKKILAQFQSYLKKILFSLSKMIFIQFAYMEII